MRRTNHVALDSLAIFGASLIDILASLVGAYETDGFYGRMVTDEVYSCNNTDTETHKSIDISAIWILMHPKPSDCVIFHTVMLSVYYV